jgi:N-glycosidase YbiA
MENHPVEIRFYLKRDPYGCFSNFAPYQVEIDGRIWKTTEHYYHAQRFAGTEYEEVIREIKTPFQAKEVAKSGVYPRRKDWFDVKFDIMMKAIRAKFEQHNDLRDILVSTGNAILKEHTELDHYWADGGDGSGKSRLGEALMIVRSSFPEYEGLFFEPPWKAFPTKMEDKHFWAEGDGKEHLKEFLTWYGKLSPIAKKEYERYYILPGNWEEFKNEFHL